MPDASHSDSNLVPTTFKWPHWGSNVKVAGSFDSPYSPWSPIQMTKLEGSSEFVVTLNLKPNITYYYKYVVDEQWVLNQDIPSHPDSSGYNYNHVIVVEPLPPDNELEDGNDNKNNIDVINEKIPEQDVDQKTIYGPKEEVKDEVQTGEEINEPHDTVETITDDVTVETVTDTDNVTVETITDDVTVETVTDTDNVTVETITDDVTVETITDDVTVETITDDVTVETVTDTDNLTVKTITDDVTVETVTDTDNLTVKTITDDVTVETITDTDNVTVISHNEEIPVNNAIIEKESLEQLEESPENITGKDDHELSDEFIEKINTYTTGEEIVNLSHDEHVENSSDNVKEEQSEEIYTSKEVIPDYMPAIKTNEDIENITTELCDIVPEEVTKDIETDIIVTMPLSETQGEVEQIDVSINHIDNKEIGNAPKVFVIDASDTIEPLIKEQTKQDENIIIENQEILHEQKMKVFEKVKDTIQNITIETNDTLLSSTGEINHVNEQIHEIVEEITQDNLKIQPTSEEVVILEVNTPSIIANQCREIAQDVSKDRQVKELESEIMIKDNSSEIVVNDSFSTIALKDEDHDTIDKSQNESQEHNTFISDLVGDHAETSVNLMNNENVEKTSEEIIENNYEKNFKETIGETVETATSHEILQTKSFQREEQIETADIETIKESIVNDETVKAVETTLKVSVEDNVEPTPTIEIPRIESSQHEQIKAVDTEIIEESVIKETSEEINAVNVVHTESLQHEQDLTEDQIETTDTSAINVPYPESFQYEQKLIEEQVKTVDIPYIESSYLEQKLIESVTELSSVTDADVPYTEPSQHERELIEDQFKTVDVETTEKILDENVVEHELQATELTPSLGPINKLLDTENFVTEQDEILTNAHDQIDIPNFSLSDTWSGSPSIVKEPSEVTAFEVSSFNKHITEVEKETPEESSNFKTLVESNNEILVEPTNEQTSKTEDPIGMTENINDNVDKIYETTSSHVINEAIPSIVEKASHIFDVSGSEIKDVSNGSSKFDSNTIPEEIKPLEANKNFTPEKTIIETPNNLEKLESGHPVIDTLSSGAPESSVTANLNLFSSDVSTTATIYNSSKEVETYTTIEDQKTEEILKEPRTISNTSNNSRKNKSLTSGESTREITQEPVITLKSKLIGKGNEEQIMVSTSRDVVLTRNNKKLLIQTNKCEKIEGGLFYLITTLITTFTLGIVSLIFKSVFGTRRN